MKTETILGTSSIRAAADLVKHRFIGFDGNLCGANAKARGVSAADTKSGQICPINIAGEVLVESGGAITAGVPVASDANGKAVSVAGQPNLEAVNGYAVDAASGAGEFIRVRLV